MRRSNTQRNANFYALIVGVGEYVGRGFRNLPETAEDARLLESILKDPKLCGYPASHVTSLIGQYATVDNMCDALEDMQRSATPESTVVIYFSGHGGYGIKGDRWEHPFLCLREADAMNLEESALSGEDFSAALKGIQAARLVVILDCCFAAAVADLKGGENDESGDGPLDGSATWKMGFSEDFYRALSVGEGRVVLASSKDRQPSYVHKVLSTFTYHLDRALRGGAAVRGDRLIHILDVFHYVSEAMEQASPPQTPILKADNVDKNFAIALDRGGRKSEAAEDDTSSSPLHAIRERIIADPIEGGHLLSDFLAQQPDHTLRNRVDVLRADLVRMPPVSAEDAQLAWSGKVFALLQICTRLEDGGDASLPDSAPIPTEFHPSSKINVQVVGDPNVVNVGDHFSQSYDFRKRSEK